MSIWRQLLIIALLAAVAYGAYEGYQRAIATTSMPPETLSRPAARPAIVETASAEVRTLSETVEAVGTTLARQSVEIVPEASGRIEEIFFVPGQHVEQGAILVQLDDAIARADVAEARARLTERKHVHERMARLRGSSAVSQAGLEEAVARLAEAQAQLDRADQRFADRTIRAPFGGTVGLAEVDRGARVTAGTVITRLDDLSEVEVEFSLPEALFSQIRVGQKITATSVAFPDLEFYGQIEAVDSRIDPVSRSFRTRAVIPNSDGTLPAGMFMALELTLSQSDQIVVPEEAIVFQAAETYVFTLDDNKARRVIVETGQRRDGVVAVLDGLSASDEVIVRGLHRVRDGGVVEVLTRPDASGAVRDSGS